AGRAVGLDLGDVGVQEQVEVLLGPHLLQQQQVPVVGVPVGVAVLVLHEQLAHDPGLAGEHVDAVRGRAAHPHPHLARGVPAEHGPVLDQGDAASLAGGGDRGADTGEAASDDDDVVLVMLGVHASCLSCSKRIDVSRKEIAASRVRRCATSTHSRLDTRVSLARPAKYWVHTEPFRIPVNSGMCTVRASRAPGSPWRAMVVPAVSLMVFARVTAASLSPDRLPSSSTSPSRSRVETTSPASCGLSWNQAGTPMRSSLMCSSRIAGMSPHSANRCTRPASATAAAARSMASTSRTLALSR